MRIVLIGLGILLTALVSGVAMARFTIHGSLDADSGTLIVPRAELRTYTELCGSCGAPSAPPASPDPAY